MTDDQNTAIETYDETPPPPLSRSRIPDEPGFFRQNIGAILWAIILVLLAIFIGQNWRTEKIDVLFWSFKFNLSLALIAAAIVGIILGWLVPIIWKHRRRDRVRE